MEQGGGSGMERGDGSGVAVGGPNEQATTKSTVVSHAGAEGVECKPDADPAMQGGVSQSTTKGTARLPTAVKQVSFATQPIHILKSTWRGLYKVRFLPKMHLLL